MLTTAIATTGLALAAVLVADWRGLTGLEWVAKPLASAGFMAVAVLSGATTTTYGMAILAALALSMVGDVALIARGRGAGFLMGLGAFLLGHVAFAVAFVVRGVSLPHTLVAAIPLIAVASVVLRWLIPHVATGMRAPVFAYVAAICAMVALSLGTLAGPSPHPLIPATATVFLLSDLCVARNRFVAPGLTNRLIGLPLYYAAQIGFALTPGL